MCWLVRVLSSTGSVEREQVPSSEGATGVPWVFTMSCGAGAFVLAVSLEEYLVELQVLLETLCIPERLFGYRSFSVWSV